MDLVFLFHLLVFLIAAVLSFASIPRARTIKHRTTREGFVAILVTTGLWSVGYLGYFLLPTAPVKVAAYTFGLLAALGCVGAWLYFSAAYTGRPVRNAPYRRFIVGSFVVIALLKLTNPIHQLYFTTEWVTEPFPHLAINQGILHWVILGISYVAIGVSFFMLLERFYHSGKSAKPLAGLVGFTALPIVFNLYGATGNSLLPIWYEPIGVAIFAVGTLFVYFDHFEAIRFTGEADEPTIFLDQSGEIRDSNQAARTLFPSLSEGIGQPLEAVLPRIEETISEDTPEPLRIERGDSSRYYQVATSPITAGEVVTGQVVSLSDVTEREQYRRELETTTEQLEALNRLVRHDIRNDMAVLAGWVEMLPDDLEDPVDDVIRRVRRTSEHVIDLTESSSDLVDALTDHKHVKLEPIDLRSTLELEIEAVRENYPAAVFRVDGAIPDVTVRANEVLSSVFRNLLSNAVVHNDTETPEVTIRCETLDEAVRVRIADNGPGISDAQKEEIFGKGEKGLESGGTGIGLYLVQTLVDLYEGTVWVEDNEPRGGIFVVELPRTD